jgi:TRAP-type C4-dicarboxylate transport system permease small subunit
MRCPLCGSDLAADAVEKCPECGWRIGAPSGLFSAIARVEDVVISVVLLSMILLVLVQIGLRNFYSTGMSGGAEIVRHMLLWVAFLGAAIAAREGKHIRIDLAQRILKKGPKNVVDVITSLFTAIVCVMLFYASIQFIRNEYEMGTIIPFFNMKVWVLELVIPLGYGAVTLRYLARCAQSFMQLVKGI